MNDSVNKVVDGKLLWKLFTKISRTQEHCIFLSICEHCEVIPKGLIIKKEACVGDGSNVFKREWNDIKLEASKQFMRSILKEQWKKLGRYEMEFWRVVVESVEKSSDKKAVGDFVEWLWWRKGEVEMKWTHTSHKKISNLCQDYKVKCQDFYLHEFRFNNDFQFFCQAFKLPIVSSSHKTNHSSRPKKKDP